MKKVMAILMALLLLPQSFVFAESNNKIEESVEYDGYELIAGYIADMYIDDSYTAEDIMKLGVSKYLEKYGDEALVEFLKGALNSLDDYSTFYTRSEFIEYNNNLNQTFYGLGVVLQQMDEYVVIKDFSEENSLAEQSGFKVGDKIIGVEGKDVVGNSVTEVRNLLVGELGTTVTVTVLRDDTELDIIGTRTAVNNTTVYGVILNGNIGYIRIASFSSNTADEFSEISQKFQSEGVTKLILDLRNNPGGYVDAAERIAKEIVPKGKIVDVKYRDKTQSQTIYSDLEKAPFDMAVLVNKSTASSSEILASAIQDSGAGILIGEQTFGKAVIQNAIPLKNGMVIKLTVGKYLTRNGNEIAGVGLTPDKTVKNYTEKIDTSDYAKFDFLTPTALGASGVNVTAAKERLSVMNYFIGNMNNDVYNVDLKDAVKAFQSDNGLTDTGVLDVPTQIKIKEVFEKLETEVDVQLREAYKYFGGNEDELFEATKEQ